MVGNPKAVSPLNLTVWVLGVMVYSFLGTL